MKVRSIVLVIAAALTAFAHAQPQGSVDGVSVTAKAVRMDYASGAVQYDGGVVMQVGSEKDVQVSAGRISVSSTTGDMLLENGVRLLFVDGEFTTERAVLKRIGEGPQPSVEITAEQMRLERRN